MDDSQNAMHFEGKVHDVEMNVEDLEMESNDKRH